MPGCSMSVHKWSEWLHELVRRSVSGGGEETIFEIQIINAWVAELVYAHDSKSCGEIHVGSTPTSGT